MRQVAPRFGEPRLWVLDRRISDLEGHVALLTEAVQVLIRALAAHSDDEPVRSAAQQAADALRAAGRARAPTAKSD